MISPAGLREGAVVIAAVFGILAAVLSQLTYFYLRRAEPDKYFGGAPVQEDVSEESLRADGACERAALRAAFCQSSTTSLIVATALIGLYAGFPNGTTAAVAIVAVAIGVGQPLFALMQLWPRDRRVVASTEYYVMMQEGAKTFPVDEQRRMFAREHPKLARWL